MKNKTLIPKTKTLRNKTKETIFEANQEKVVDLSTGNIELKKRIDKHEVVIYSILLIVALSLVTVVISVTGLFLDQLRYNRATYEMLNEKHNKPS